MKTMMIAVVVALCASCSEMPVQPDIPYSNHRIIERDLSGGTAAIHQEKT